MTQDFLRDVICCDFPAVQLHVYEHSWWSRFLRRLIGSEVQVAMVVKHVIYVPTTLMQSAQDDPQLTEVLAHEYVHLWQQANDRWFYVRRGWPYIAMFVLVVGVALWSLSMWFLLFAIIPLLPVYNPVVAREEYEAYCASILARICLANNHLPLPAQGAHRLFGLSAASLRGMVNTMFSSTYLMQWASPVVRQRYFDYLWRWQEDCKFNYFRARFAFEQNNGYLPTSFATYFRIGTDRPSRACWRRPHNRILRYLVQFSKR